MYICSCLCLHTHTDTCYVYTFWRPQPFYPGSGSKGLQTGPSCHTHKECLPKAGWPALLLQDQIPGPQRLKDRVRDHPWDS